MSVATMILSPREKQVCNLIALGMTNKEIGRELKIGHRTVEEHRTNVLRKKHVTTSIKLVRKLWEEDRASWLRLANG